MANKPRWGEPGETIAIYVSKEQARVLRAAAKTEQTTVSDMVRRVIRKYFFLPEDASHSKKAS